MRCKHKKILETCIHCNKIEYPKYKREEKLSAKLSEEDVLECKHLRISGCSLRAIAKKFNITSSTVWMVTQSDEKLKELGKIAYKKIKIKGVKEWKKNNKKVQERKKKLKGKELKVFHHNEWENMKKDKEAMEKHKKSGLKYIENNKDKITEYQKGWYKKNIIKISLYGKKYRLENKEKITETKRKYRLKNKEKFDKYQKEWAEKNKDKIALYAKRCKEKKKNLQT